MSVAAAFCKDRYVIRTSGHKKEGTNYAKQTLFLNFRHMTNDFFADFSNTKD